MSTTDTTNYDDYSAMFPKGVKTEPRLLLDVTGSMFRKMAENGSLSRKDYVLEAIGGLVRGIEAFDSMAATEQASGDDEKGGLFCVTFANGQGVVIGDLNSSNLQRQLAKIRWDGSTTIMPGWKALVDDYMDEFGSDPDRPALLVEVITDGVADDTKEFIETLGGLKGSTRVVVAIVGYGNEHDRALASYQAMAAQHPQNLRVVSFAEASDPDELTKAMLSVAGLQN